MLIQPSQIAALTAAAADPQGQLRRTRGPKGAAYTTAAAPGAHTPVTVIGLARAGLLAEHAPGFQSVFVLTENGRRVAEANLRAQQAVRA